MATALLGVVGKVLLQFSLPQMVPGLIVGYQSGKRNASTYRANCQRAASLRLLQQRMKQNLLEAEDAEHSVEDVQRLLDGLQSAAAESQRRTAERQAAFKVKVAIVVLACVAVSSLAIYTIRKRSHALRDVLQDISQDVLVLQQRASRPVS